jgi:hypothetical protein
MIAAKSWSSCVNADTAQLVARLEDALALYDEPIWRDLQSLLTEQKPARQPTEEKPVPAETPKEWHKANPERVRKERDVLSRLLQPTPSYPHLFFEQTGTNQLGATGMVRVIGGKPVKVELIFPDDYPTSPPRVFFFGPALKTIPQLLRDDGSVPVPFGADQQWTTGSNSGMALAWAIEWLERTVKVVTSSGDRALTRLKPTGPMYGESTEEYEKRINKGREA